jgi:hypothetical protein
MTTFFKASTDEKDVKPSTSAYINQSGFYPVTILAPLVSVSKNGSTSIDFYLDHEGQKQTIYGNLRITNNDGKPNTIGAKLFNQLLVIAGVDEVSEPVDMELPIGKKETDKTASVLEDLMDIDVLMRIQLSYSVYQGKIQESRNIRSFFRAEDTASAEEVLSGDDVGKGYERDAKYADNVTYEDGLTAESVAAWVAAGRTGGAGASADTAKKAPSFGARRFGK